MTAIVSADLNLNYSTVGSGNTAQTNQFAFTWPICIQFADCHGRERHLLGHQLGR